MFALNKHSTVRIWPFLLFLRLPVAVDHSTLIQPFVVHDLFYLPQKMIRWYQWVYVNNDWLFSCVPFYVKVNGSRKCG